MQERFRRWRSDFPVWKTAVIAVVVLPLLIFSGLILVAVPLLVFVTLIYHVYEVRFQNPVTDVWIDDAYLQLERRGETDRVALADIESMSLSTMNNPPHCVVHLSRPCRWGQTYTWFPDRSAVGGAEQVVAELQRSIDTAKQAGVR